MDEHGHKPVLARRTLELLAPQPGEIAVDLTTGRGGHSVLLAEAVGRRGRVVGFDLDRANLDHARRRVEAIGAGFTGFGENFTSAPSRLAELGLRADVVLADLGFSSNQMDDPARGLSFRADGPLDMRYDTAGPVTAADLLASLTERELADLIYEFGEEPLSRKIARKLVQRRHSKPIQTTAELALLVLEAYGRRARSSRMHPATRTFMALRIAVNDELASLGSLLDAIADAAGIAHEGAWLGAGARVVIISFHSLEDRLVKHAFADIARHGRATTLTRKPLQADAGEVQANVRSRSAKLRAIRIDGPIGE